jgi:hypothetical protein
MSVLRSRSALSLPGCRDRRHVNGNPRMLSAQPTEDGRQEAGNEGFVASNPDLANRRIGEKLDVPHSLTQVVEDSHPTIQQCATVDGGLDALRAPIEKSNPERAFQICNGPGHGGLGHVEFVGRFSHAAGLNNGHQNIELAEFQPASDPRVPRHGLCSLGYANKVSVYPLFELADYRAFGYFSQAGLRDDHRSMSG